MKFRPSFAVRFVFYEFLVLVLIGFVGAHYFAVLPEEKIKPDPLNPYLRVGTVAFFILASLVLLYVEFVVNSFWQKCRSSIVITDATIKWNCPLMKSRELPLSKCVIFVETETSKQGITYPYICFSLQPQRKIEKIGTVPCTDVFIKFWYRKVICDYLIEHLPKEQTRQLEYYRYTEEHEDDKKPRKRRKK